MIRQTPWFERKFSFDFPTGLFPVILERLRGATSRIQSLVADRTDEQLSRKVDRSWSVKEHIGHLYDLEELWYGRVEDFFSGQATLRAADLRNTKTHEANHNARSVQDLLEQFSQARNKLVDKVKDIDETTASLVALHPRLQLPLRFIDALFFVAEHDDHHLAKMRELLP